MRPAQLAFADGEVFAAGGARLRRIVFPSAAGAVRGD
jgi:hypothetical protein